MKKQKQLKIFKDNQIPPIVLSARTLANQGQSPVLYLNNHYIYSPLLFYFLLVDDQQTILGRTHRSGIFCIECKTDQFIEIRTARNPARIVEEIRFACTQCRKTSLTCYYEFRSAIDITLLPTIKDKQVVISEDGRKISYKIFREEILEKAQTILYDPEISTEIKI